MFNFYLCEGCEEMKSFPPVLRERRRYIVFKLNSPKKFVKKEVEKALTDVVFKTIGLFGAVDSSYWLVKFYEDKQIGVLRVTNEFKNVLFGSLAFLEEIKGHKLVLKLIKTTGTIKKAEQVAKNFS